MHHATDPALADHRIAKTQSGGIASRGARRGRRQPQRSRRFIAQGGKRNRAAEAPFEHLSAEALTVRADCPTR